MDTPYPSALIQNNLPDVIIPDHNVQPKFKAQASFVIKSEVLCYSLYLYHDEVRSDDLMKEFTIVFGMYTYGIIYQDPNV